MSTTFERPRFFTGQLVTADDLAQDQDYLREKLRRHNRMLHGWGIVCGLDVTAAGGKAAVAPGYALGPDGDEIVIGEATTIDISAYDGATVYLAVRYVEEPTRPVPVPGGAEGAVEYSRIRDSYELEVLTELPAAAGDPCVILADLVVTGGELRDVNEAHRRYVACHEG